MNLQDYIVGQHDSILKAMKVIEINSKGIVFVCEEGTLLGSVTDGDIRRYIITNGDLSKEVGSIANQGPFYLNINNECDYTTYMMDRGIKAVPLLDSNGKVVDIKFLYHIPSEETKKIEIPVVIMAGGKGTRLKPLTNILPKPLIPIGNKTITEHIMDNFERYGCTGFHMIINYKKNLIKSYFNDSEKKRNISFVEEEDYLGTAGGLSLLELNEDAVFLTNCDIILNADYTEIYNYHKKQNNIITLVCAKKKLQIPYGTVNVSENHCVQELVEKPKFNFLANTGFYVLQKEFIDKIEKGKAVDITDLIQTCLDKGERVGVYAVEEEAWLDMGQLNELENMRNQIG